MKKNIVYLFLLVSIVVSAQKKKTHTIELLPNKTEIAFEADFYISEIIDNRIIKTNIGIAQKGMLNKKVLSVFSKPFDVEILDYLETILPKDSSKTALTLRINQLLISEHTGAFKEEGKAIVRLEVLKRNGDSIYGRLGSFEAMRTKNSMDVTGKHDDRIRAVLKDCLVEFNDLDWTAIEPYEIDINTPSVSKILQESPQVGFFATYTELANNNAITDIPFMVQDRSKDEKLHLKDSVSRKKLTHFAYNDGNTIYLNASTYSGERHYIKTERMDEFLLFNDVFVNQDQVMGATMAFGVLGLLASNEAQTVMFDLNTGQFITLSKSKMRSIIKEEFPDLYKTMRKQPSNFGFHKAILDKLYTTKTPEAFRAVIRQQ